MTVKEFFSFIHKPKHVGAVSVIIALLIGIASYAIINRAPDYQFAEAASGTIFPLGTLDATSSVAVSHLTLGFLSGGTVENISVRVGDAVAVGETLAALDPENTLGALTQAKAAYAAALANYQKIQNGATAADINVGSASLDAAQIALAHDTETLDQTTQDSFTACTLAVSNNTDMLFTNPESQMPELAIANASFANQSLIYKIQNERGALNTALAGWKADLANSAGISSTLAEAQTDLQSVAAYLDDLNLLLTTYTSGGSSSVISADEAAIASARASLSGQISSQLSASQNVSSAQAAVSESQASLTLTTSVARPEDITTAEAQVASAQGAVQIAEAAYDNRLITAPSAGIVTAVYISEGQIAAPSAPAIDLSATTSAEHVALLIPTSAIIDNGGMQYVLAKSGNQIKQTAITTGISDATNTQIISGLVSGESVVIH